MYVVLIAERGAPATLRRLDDEGTPRGDAEAVPDLAATVARIEELERPRWVWAATGDVYARLLDAGVRVRRCHDIELTEAILLAFEGARGQPRTLPAAWARLAGLPVPRDAAPVKESAQPGLFESAATALPGGADPMGACVAVLAEQLRRIAETPWASRLRLLIAAESAGALAAAEMRFHGLPWSTETHLRLLADLFGPRPSTGMRPAELVTLADQVSEAFDGRQVNPDHPGSVVNAFARAGIDVPSSRAAVLRDVDHPAVAPLLRYKELSRLHAAHGWSWLETWVHNGRFAPEYVVGGVVSGRWATRGGAALQLPRVLRTCVRAEPGWALVVADAAQLEPRVLAALSADRLLAELASDTDLYLSLAADSFAGQRHDAKIAMLSAMYGGTSGSAASLLAVLRKRFPSAIDYVERAAAHGERGLSVRSALGRTSPPPSQAWRELTGSTEQATEVASRRASREWGRFTRNFVVQASASDWALTMLASLRLSMMRETPDAQLVFFVHDEIVIHCPRESANRCTGLIAAAAVEATSLVFGDTAVRFPLPAGVVDCYADAK
jgi:DNA polymerase-1